MTFIVNVEIYAGINIHVFEARTCLSLVLNTCTGSNSSSQNCICFKLTILFNPQNWWNSMWVFLLLPSLQYNGINNCIYATMYITYDKLAAKNCTNLKQSNIWIFQHKNTEDTSPEDFSTQPWCSLFQYDNRNNLPNMPKAVEKIPQIAVS